MNGYRFYLEYENNSKKRKGTRKNPGEHLGTVIAVIVDSHFLSGSHCSGSQPPEWVYDVVSSVYTEPNSPCCGSLASLAYIQDNCKRISEKLAREIHPELFVYLDIADPMVTDEGPGD
jgi:hypothetical protein